MHTSVFLCTHVGLPASPFCFQRYIKYTENVSKRKEEEEEKIRTIAKKERVMKQKKTEQKKKKKNKKNTNKISLQSPTVPHT
jgi:esterase/lipase